MSRVTSLPSFHTSHKQDQVIPWMYKCHGSIPSSLACQTSSTICLQLPMPRFSRRHYSRIPLVVFRDLISATEKVLMLSSLKGLQSLQVKVAVHFDSNSLLHVSWLFIDWHLVSIQKHKHRFSILTNFPSPPSLRSNLIGVLGQWFYRFCDIHCYCCDSSVVTWATCSLYWLNFGNFLDQISCFVSWLLFLYIITPSLGLYQKRKFDSQFGTVEEVANYGGGEVTGMSFKVSL